MTHNPFSHIDLRVPSYDLALPFYERLLPALGFTRTFHSERWRVFAAEGDLPGADWNADLSALPSVFLKAARLA